MHMVLQAREKWLILDEGNMDAYLNGKAEKQYERLNEPILSRITEAIDKLEKEPPEGDIVPIAGKHQHFRTRVGNYRILWRIKDNAILVTNSDPRGQAYKKGNIQ